MNKLLLMCIAANANVVENTDTTLSANVESIKTESHPKAAEKQSVKTAETNTAEPKASIFSKLNLLKFFRSSKDKTEVVEKKQKIDWEHVYLTELHTELYKHSNTNEQITCYAHGIFNGYKKTYTENKAQATFDNWTAHPIYVTKVFTVLYALAILTAISGCIVCIAVSNNEINDAIKKTLGTNSDIYLFIFDSVLTYMISWMTIYSLFTLTAYAYHKYMGWRLKGNVYHSKNTILHAYHRYAAYKTASLAKKMLLYGVVSTVMIGAIITWTNKK